MKQNLEEEKSGKQKSTMLESDMFLYPAVMYAIKYKNMENFYQDKNIKHSPVKEFVEGKTL